MLNKSINSDTNARKCTDSEDKLYDHMTLTWLLVFGVNAEEKYTVAAILYYF